MSKGFWGPEDTQDLDFLPAFSFLDAKRLQNKMNLYESYDLAISLEA